MALKTLDDANRRLKKRKWQDGLNAYKWRSGWQRLRLYGPIQSEVRHLVKTKNKKVYYEYCLGYDVENDCFFSDKDARCECCRLKVQYQTRYFINVFDMDGWQSEQPMGPNWSPIALADFSGMLVGAIAAMKPLNGGNDIMDPVKGAIINVNYNPDSNTPANIYQVSMDEKNSPLTPEMLGVEIVQTDPEGRRVLRKGDGKLPPCFTYYRSTSTKEEMTSGLERQGYYDSEAQESSDPEVKHKANSAFKALERLDDEDEAPAPRPSGGVKQLATLVKGSPEEDEAPAPAPKKVATQQAPAPQRRAAPPPAAEPEVEAVEEEELEIPF